MWKFYDVSITQILCEVNFGNFKVLEMAIFAILGALESEFCLLGRYQLLKSAKIHENQNSQPKYVKNSNVTLLEFLKLITHKIQVIEKS